MSQTEDAQVDEGKFDLAANQCGGRAARRAEDEGEPLSPSSESSHSQQT